MEKNRRDVQEFKKKTKAIKKTRNAGQRERNCTEMEISERNKASKIKKRLRIKYLNSSIMRTVWVDVKPVTQSDLLAIPYNPLHRTSS